MEQSSSGLVSVDLTIFVMQSSPNNSEIVNDKYSNMFAEYKNLSSQLSIFGYDFPGYEKHE